MARKKSSKEKRRYKRRPSRLGGFYFFPDKSSGICRINDISVKGIGLVTSKRVSIGTRLKIKTVDKKMNPLILKGKVRWCRKASSNRWQVGIILNKPLPFPLKVVL